LTEKPENTKEVAKITEANEKLTTAVNKPLIPTTPVFLVPTPVPTVGYCTVWSQKYYRTFDGKHFIFDSTCSLILAKDCQDLGLFSIYLSTEQCAENTCKQRLTIELDTDNGMMTLQLRKEGEQAVVVDYNVDEFLTESGTVNGVEVLFVSGWVVVSSPIGFNVIWDGMSRYTVDITSEELYGGLCGLCGNNNEDQDDDFLSPEGAKQVTAERFGRSWETVDQKGPCYDESRRCTDSISATAKTEYMSVCGKLRGGVFQSCNEKVDVTPFIDACKEYICDCLLASGSDANKDVVMTECSCNAFSAYSSACAWEEEVVEWRTPDKCPLQCPDGMEYQICGSTCPQTCGNQVVDCENDYCIEGCHCPAGQMLVDNKCIAPSECPCEFNGHQIQPGRVMRDDISECVCIDGKWDCSEYDSPGRCWLAGADHFKSFDGKHFDFTGDCEYVLVTDCPSLDNDFSVNVQNYGCSQFGTSCSRAVIIMIGTTRVRVRSTEILVNDEDVKKLPAEYNGVLIDRPTTSVAKVTLSNGVQVEVTEDYRVTITAPPSLKHNLCGLCGTFNGNQEDDFYTKSGDIETTAQSFGSKWQTSAFCDTPAYHFNFCMLHQQHFSLAVEKCTVFKMVNGPFSECLSVLDSEAYYHACMSQVCGCKTSECSCTIIEQYAVDCSAKGVVLKWRDSIPACAVACEGDLVYHECASTCGSSCASLSSGFPCHPGCVPGCACPEGKVLDQDGSCVTPSECPCPSDNGLVSPGFLYQSPCGPCECTNGSFTCEKEVCSDECGNHMAFSTCKPSQSKTCANMESHKEQLPGQCVPGCVCLDGFVFDENVMECVAPDNCPCQHGGNVYKKGEDIMIGCNKCTCIGTSWECEEKECPGICTAWGDPHFTSFDGKRFDLHGDCDYELASNHYNKQDDGFEPFRIVIKNVPCGVAGVTCTKSVKFTIGSGRDKDKVHLVRGKPMHVTSRNPDRIRVSEVGLYVFVHTNIGVTLTWDKGTWVQVKLDPYYKGQVSGLCGNYNGNQNDDFTKRSGMPAISATEFGHSWRLHNYCVESEVIQSACSLYPARELWARRKCAILKSDVFRPCHSVVSPDLYIQQCVNDACNCNGGTGCEKLCTAISAYAHQCSAMKVYISWRNQNLCPIQCQGCQEYKPCIGVCSACENKFRLISQDDGSDQCPDTCVEGCACPEGKVMQNGECVDMCDALPTQSSFQRVTEKTVSLPTKPQVSDGKSSASDKCKSTCNKMYGEVFRPCHTTQSPILFYEICKQPAFLCNECMVLERYAQICSVFGVVLDWRESSKCEVEGKDKTTNSELLLSAVTTLMTTRLPTTQVSSTVQALDVKMPTTTQSEMQTTFTHAPTTTNLAPTTTNLAPSTTTRAPLATAQTQNSFTQTPIISKQTPYTTSGTSLATTQNATTQKMLTTTIHTQPATTTTTQRPSGATPESTTQQTGGSMSTTSPQAVSFLGSTRPTTTETPSITMLASTTTVQVLLSTNPESTATTQASLPNASKSASTQPLSTTSSELLTATTRESSATQESAPYFTNTTQPLLANSAGSTTSSQASLATTLRSTTNIQPQSSTTWLSTTTQPLSTTASESSAFDQLLLATTLVSTNTSRAPLVTTQQSSATTPRSTTTTTSSSSATTVESITESSQASSAATPFSTSNTKTPATNLESISSSQVTSETTVESTTSSQASLVTNPRSTATTTPSSSATTTVESTAFSHALSAANPISNTNPSATTLESQATSATNAGPSTASQEVSSATTPISTNNNRSPSSTTSWPSTTIQPLSTTTSQSPNSDQLSLGTTFASTTTVQALLTTNQDSSATTLGSTPTTSQSSSALRSTPNSNTPSPTSWSTTNIQASSETTLDSTTSSQAYTRPNSWSTTFTQAPPGTTDQSTTSYKASLETTPRSTTDTISTITQPPSTITSESPPADIVTTMSALTTTAQGLSVSTTNLESTGTTQSSSATIVESTISSHASSATTPKSTINTQTPVSTTSWSSTNTQPASSTSSESPTSGRVSLITTPASTTQSLSAITLESTNSHTSSETILMSTTGTSAPLSTTLWSTTSRVPSVTTIWSTTSRQAPSETTPRSTNITQASSATMAESTISLQAISETTSESLTTAKATTSCPDYCSDVYNTVFEPCHQFINPELYYFMCRAEHSMCSDCLILEAYASRCTQFGLNIPWRYGNCELTTPAPTHSVPIVETSPTSECPNLCSELYSDRFKPCHAIMNPDFFYASCQAAHASCSECSVLSTYAQICQNLGHCIKLTSDGLCAVDCPSGQEYRECICHDQEHCGGQVSCHAAMMVSECTCPQGFELVSGECQPCATITPTLTPITTTTTATTTEFVCPTSIISQCEHVMTDVFKPCHGFVDPEEFVQECKAACSNSCDLLESYANTCQILHGICLAWRSESICPVSCGSVFSYGGPVDLVYKQCVCPKQSCVEDNGSCFNSQLVSECMCPDGMQASGNVKEDGSCIACSASGTCGIVTKVSTVKFDLDGLTCTAEVMSSQCSGRCASGTGTVANIFDSLLQITMIRETCNVEEVAKVEQTLRCFDGREKTILIENAVTCACGNACQ
ncbi:mucin-5AC-like, partial [Anneissia japonica]|uniref:mucin-5AC-like n=1 Tax=Anneissia japonica TaxID=1529436 RepID=UPI001425617E